MSQREEKKANAVYADHFTRVPNILFESYKYITKEEVLLYIRLRYIYWDTKPRYLSLRELADATGYSTGALSKMLPRLNTVGLVHAEVKKKKGHDGKEKGNPVYHISINDIWEENRKFFADGKFDPSEVLLVHQMNATCSPNEQDTAKPVHQMNKPVHKTNKAVQEMNDPVPFGEQDQAQNAPPKITYKTSNKTSLQEERVIHARALSEHENDSYRHDHTRSEDTWNCHNWRVAHGGLEIASCTDYQAWIENGGRDEPTDKMQAVKIGVTDDTPMAVPAPGDTSGGAGIPAPVLDRGSVRRDGVALETSQQNALRAAGATQPQVAIASTPGSVGTPLPTQTRQSPSPTDGAATVAEGSESRASGKHKAHLSAHEAEMKAWLEELRATELDLDKRDETAIQSLATKKGTDDKEMFLNIVAVIDSDPWFEEHNISVDFYWINRQWNNKYMFLQRKKPKAALDDGERHSDFDIYKGNGPEERKRWREEGARLKALGYSPDL